MGSLVWVGSRRSVPSSYRLCTRSTATLRCSCRAEKRFRFYSRLGTRPCGAAHSNKRQRHRRSYQFGRTFHEVYARAAKGGEQDQHMVRPERPMRLFTPAAPPSPTIISQMAELNFQLEHVYGLTETYGPFTINEPPPGFGSLDAVERARLRARQGVPNLLAGEVRVVDDEMHDVPRDAETLGEVVMRGNVVMKGYYRDPEATEKAFAGGWFHSGDVGVMHTDGSIELRDRKKDIIISGGENISTIEVEQALVSHPDVLEAAVVAIPHEKWGEVPKAFVTLSPAGRSVPKT